MAKLIKLTFALMFGLVILPARADFQVFACEPEWASLVVELMPAARTTSATHHLQDPHYIEARPSLIAAMRRADLAVCTGASLEAGWLPVLLKRAANPAIQPGREGLFFAADQVELAQQHTHVDRSMGDVHAEGNPHLHLSPYLLPKVAKALAAKLQALNPQESEAIKARYQQWQADWQAQQARWLEQAKQLNGRALVVQHASFYYLLHWLGVEAALDLEPKPGLAPSVSHLSRLLAEPALERVDAILVAAHQDRQPADWLAGRTGLPVVMLPATVTEDVGTARLTDLISMQISALLDATRKDGADGQL